MKLRLVGQQTKHTKIQEVIEKKTTEQNANRSDNKPQTNTKTENSRGAGNRKNEKMGKELFGLCWAS